MPSGAPGQGPTRESAGMTELRRSLGRGLRRLGLRPSRPADPAYGRLDSARPKIEWSYPVGGDGDHRLQVFRHILSLFPPGRLVDLGAGHGAFSLAALDLGWQVTAVDARTDRMPMTPGIDWIQQDVRTFDLPGFDIVLVLGLLYHLEIQDQLALLRRCSQTVTILDTHHSERPTHLERGYAGHTFHELPAERAAELPSSQRAAWGNMSAFWPTQPDLVRMLHDCGFETVLALVPPNVPGRTFYLCLPPRSQRGD